MNHRPWTVIINAVIILLNLLIWLGLGILIAVNAHPGLSIPPAMQRIMAIMSIGMAAILLLLSILLYRGARTAYYLILAFFGVTALLTIFDDVGLADVVVLVLNILPIILLIYDRKWYLRDRTTDEPVLKPPES